MQDDCSYERVGGQIFPKAELSPEYNTQKFQHVFEGNLNFFNPAHLKESKHISISRLAKKSRYGLKGGNAADNFGFDPQLVQDIEKSYKDMLNNKGKKEISSFFKNLGKSSK